MSRSRECTVALAVAVASAFAATLALADSERDGVPVAHSCIVQADGRSRGLSPEGLVPRAREALADTNHLRVTFDSPDDPWTPTETSRLQVAAAAFLPVLEQVCGPPSGPDVIDVIKDKSLFDQGLAGTYSPWDHSIRLYQVDVVTLCHELAHAFHGNDIAYWDGFEEGMAVAATAQVMSLVSGFPKADHVGGTDDVEYELLNQPAISPNHGFFWAGMPGVNLRYDLAGYVWRKTALEHPGFLREFNRRYYAGLALDDNLRSSVGDLVAIAGQVAPTVEAQPFAEWADRQYVLGTTAQLGVQIYLYPIASAALVFYRHADGYEEPLPDQALVWKATDADGLSAGGGTVLTDFGGLTTLALAVRPFAQGNLHLDAETSTPYGSQTTALDRPVKFGTGIFGLVKGARDGSVTVTSLDGLVAPATVPVQWGEFEAPAFRDVAGRFVLAYTDPEGRTAGRMITKDVGNYLALIEAPQGPLGPASASLVARPSIALNGCRFSLSRPLSDPAHVTIYSVSGKILRVLTIPAGALAVDWDGQGQDGLFASAGVYIARAVAPGMEARTRLVVTH